MRLSKLSAVLGCSMIACAALGAPAHVFNCAITLNGQAEETHCGTIRGLMDQCSAELAQIVGVSNITEDDSACEVEDPSGTVNFQSTTDLSNPLLNCLDAGTLLSSRIIPSTTCQ